MTDLTPNPHQIQVGDQSYSTLDVIEALTPHMLPERLARYRAVAAQRLGSLALGLEDLHHNHNGAACLRTAEALGVQNVVAAELRNTYPLDEEEPDRRITMAAHNWLDFHHLDSTERLLSWAQSRGMRIFGAGPHAKTTLGTLPIDRPLLLLFGNEADGLRPETLAACDDSFQIPMFGFTESFNVSVSVGMALGTVAHRVRAQLHADGRTGDLADHQRDALIARWCLTGVRAAEQIVARKLG